MNVYFLNPNMVYYIKNGKMQSVKLEKFFEEISASSIPCGDILNIIIEDSNIDFSSIPLMNCNFLDVCQALRIQKKICHKHQYVSVLGKLNFLRKNDVTIKKIDIKNGILLDFLEKHKIPSNIYLAQDICAFFIKKNFNIISENWWAVIFDIDYNVRITIGKGELIVFSRECGVNVDYSLEVYRTLQFMKRYGMPNKISIFIAQNLKKHIEIEEKFYVTLEAIQYSNWPEFIFKLAQDKLSLIPRINTISNNILLHKINISILSILVVGSILCNAYLAKTNDNLKNNIKNTLYEINMLKNNVCDLYLVDKFDLNKLDYINNFFSSIIDKVDILYLLSKFNFLKKYNLEIAKFTYDKFCVYLHCMSSQENYILLCNYLEHNKSISLFKNEVVNNVLDVIKIDNTIDKDHNFVKFIMKIQ